MMLFLKGNVLGPYASAPLPSRSCTMAGGAEFPVFFPPFSSEAMETVVWPVPFIPPFPGMGTLFLPNPIYLFLGGSFIVAED